MKRLALLQVPNCQGAGRNARCSRDRVCAHRPTDLLFVTGPCLRNRSFVLGLVTTIIHPESRRRDFATDSDRPVSSWVMERAANRPRTNPSPWQNKRRICLSAVVPLTEFAQAKAFMNCRSAVYVCVRSGSFWARGDCGLRASISSGIALWIR
jgi:hypothetical protein